jgi:anthranilate phosphoribosyltransferase
MRGQLTCRNGAAHQPAQLHLRHRRFGIGRAPPGDLAGGDAVYNAKVVRSVAEGEPGPALDAVLANVAGALAARISPAALDPLVRSRDADHL